MSGQDWPAGTVATATVRGVEGVRVMRTKSGWYITDDDSGTWQRDGFGEYLTDIRPLVVIDLDETIGKSLLPHWLRNSIRKVEEGCVSPSSIGKDMAWLAEQIEAQTKPPRIPEPDWGVRVTASTKGGGRRQFVHAYGFEGGPDGVWTDAAGFHAAWSDLIDPVLVRPVIEDAS